MGSGVSNVQRTAPVVGSSAYTVPSAEGWTMVPSERSAGLA